MINCQHQWQKIHEEFLLGGSCPIGYQCKICNTFVRNDQIPISGLPGIDTKEQVLYGPHGGIGTRSDGTKYKKQTYYPNGKLEIT